MPFGFIILDPKDLRKVATHFIKPKTKAEKILALGDSKPIVFFSQILSNIMRDSMSMFTHAFLTNIFAFSKLKSRYLT